MDLDFLLPSSTYKMAEDGEEQEYYPTRQRQNPYMSTLDRYSSNITTLTNPKDTLYDFELFLRRLREVDGRLMKVTVGGVWKPLLNDEGINTVLMSMQSILNPMTVWSNLDDREVGVIIKDLNRDMVKLLAFNKDTFKVDEINRSLVAGYARRFCYLFLKRPYKEGDRRFFGRITQEIRHHQEITKPRTSGGSVVNPFNWFKKN